LNCPVAHYTNPVGMGRRDGIRVGSSRMSGGCATASSFGVGIGGNKALVNVDDIYKRISRSV
jgi:hypothetical protein